MMEKKADWKKKKKKKEELTRNETVHCTWISRKNCSLFLLCFFTWNRTSNNKTMQIHWSRLEWLTIRSWPRIQAKEQANDQCNTAQNWQDAENQSTFIQLMRFHDKTITELSLCFGSKGKGEETWEKRFVSRSRDKGIWPTERKEQNDA